VALLRTAVPEVDRREHPRQPGDIDGTLAIPGRPALQVEVRNIRDGQVGVAFAAGAKLAA